ncbi:MAG: hypothetical protein ACK6BG_14030 [Cyanobacteriota bacterium]
MGLQQVILCYGDPHEQHSFALFCSLLGAQTCKPALFVQWWRKCGTFVDHLRREALNFLRLDSKPLFSHHSYLMSQPKTRAVHTRRLSQSLASSTLALSALAGGIMMSGGAAKATVSCGTFPPAAGLITCSEGPWTVSGWTSDGNGSGGIDLENSTVLAPAIRTGIVDIDFDPITGASTAGTITYTLTYDPTFYPDPPGTKVTDIFLTLSKPGGGTGSITKTVYSSFGGTLFGTLTADSSTTTGPLSVSGTSFYIVDVYTGSGIDSALNVFQTPGPLPILGAGAAFGFSRKLRSRVKANRSAA